MNDTFGAADILNFDYLNFAETAALFMQIYPQACALAICRT
jgi:hypothetical protein